MRKPSMNFSRVFNFFGALLLSTGFFWSGAIEAQGTVPEAAKLHDVLSKSLASYATVGNYTAFFLKQERSEGKLDTQEEIFLKFEKPFKIYMKWLNQPKKGLEVHYERGKHDGKLAIHKPGFLTGLAGVIFLSPDSPWVRKGSESYDIEDAGIGTFLADFAEAVRAASEIGALKAEWKDSRTVDVIFEVPEENDTFFAKRCVVTFDPKTSLPVAMELFDWDNQLTGRYDYRDLQINVGSNDPAFLKHVHRSLYRVWNHKE